MEVKCDALGSMRRQPVSIQITIGNDTKIINCQCAHRQKDSCSAPGYALGKCHYQVGKMFAKEGVLNVA